MSAKKTQFLDVKIKETQPNHFQCRHKMPTQFSSDLRKTLKLDYNGYANDSKNQKINKYINNNHIG